MVNIPDESQAHVTYTEMSALAARMGLPDFSYVLSEMAADEQRHWLNLREMAESLKWDKL